MAQLLEALQVRVNVGKGVTTIVGSASDSWGDCGPASGDIAGESNVGRVPLARYTTTIVEPQCQRLERG